MLTLFRLAVLDCEPPGLLLLHPGHGDQDPAPLDGCCGDRDAATRPPSRYIFSFKVRGGRELAWQCSTFYGWRRKVSELYNSALNFENFWIYFRLSIMFSNSKQCRGSSAT